MRSTPLSVQATASLPVLLSITSHGEESKPWMAELYAAAIFGEFMLIYTQMYGGKNDSGLCCVGAVSISDVAHLYSVKYNTVRRIRQEVRRFGFHNKIRTSATLADWGFHMKTIRIVEVNQQTNAHTSFDE